MKNKIKLGRPPLGNPKNIRLSVAIDQATYDALCLASERTGRHISSIARDGIEREARAHARSK